MSKTKVVTTNNSYERTEREDFEPKCACLTLSGIPVEDEDKCESDNYQMRVFAKEYPELNMQQMEEIFETMANDANFEDDYNITLDIDGATTNATCGTVGYTIADDGTLSLKKMAELFNEITKNFEMYEKEKCEN